MREAQGGHVHIPSSAVARVHGTPQELSSCANAARVLAEHCTWCDDSPPRLDCIPAAYAAFGESRNGWKSVPPP
eukprot:1701640-Amphidinium_carterae.1